MSVDLLAVLVTLAFVALLGLGRSLVARGSNQQLANGATVLVLATITGIFATGLIASLDVW